MLDRILQSRLEQVTEFKKDAVNRKELLEVRIAELTEEESLLTRLMELYKVYNPDPTVIKDKAAEDILKGSPKITKVVVSSELANALDALEKHKRKRIENKIREEIEQSLRLELEPQIRESLYEEINMVMNQEKEILSDISSIVQEEKAFVAQDASAPEAKNELFEKNDSSPRKPMLKSAKHKEIKAINTTLDENKSKEKKKRDNSSKKQVVSGPLVNQYGIVSHKLVHKEIHDYILNNGNNYVTSDELTKYFEEKHPYLSSVWVTVKKGISNVLNRMDDLEIKKSDDARINLYRIAHTT